MEEFVIEDHWSDVVEVELRFKTARKLDDMEERMLKDWVLEMVLAVGPALLESQMIKEKENR